MSRQSAGIMLVKADILLIQPKAFQDYVNKYFELKEIFGVSCYVAFLSLDGGRGVCNNSKGIAPSHSVYLHDLIDEKTDLFDWVYQQFKNPNSGIVRMSKNWDDGSSGSINEDD